MVFVDAEDDVVVVDVAEDDTTIPSWRRIR